MEFLKNKKSRNRNARVDPLKKKTHKETTVINLTVVSLFLGGKNKMKIILLILCLFLGKAYL